MKSRVMKTVLAERAGGSAGFHAAAPHRVAGVGRRSRGLGSR